LKIKERGSLLALGTTHPAALSRFLQDLSPQKQRFENLRSHN